MIPRLRDAAAGTAAALRSPLWLGAARLNELRAAPRDSARRRRDPGVAVQAAFCTLRFLARLHLPLWRNTCLYRSVAECLVLRRCGVPCRLEIGLTATAPPDGLISAHAWVVVCGDAREGSPAARAPAILQ